VQDYSEPMSGTGSQSLGGVWRLRTTEFSGRRPYRFMGEQESASGLWEMWMDASQALAVRAASRSMKMRVGGSVRSGAYGPVIRDRGLLWESADG